MESHYSVAGTGRSALEDEAPTTDSAAVLAAFWSEGALFDWFITFSFDEQTHRRERLNRSDNLLAFVKREMRRFGYFGPSVIVAHDNGNTRYYHAHVLIVGADGMGERLAQKFRRHGNVSKSEDGPIRGKGAFLYCANRALNTRTDDITYDFDLSWHRRPRKRGSGKGNLEVDSAAGATRTAIPQTGNR